LEKTLSSLPTVSDKEQRAMEVLSEAIVKKILHGPITLLKQQDRNSEGESYVDVVKKLFRLDEE
jgi:glutamyl-tRNA reductase